MFWTSPPSFSARLRLHPPQQASQHRDATGAPDTQLAFASLKDNVWLHVTTFLLARSQTKKTNYQGKLTFQGKQTVCILYKATLTIKRAQFTRPKVLNIEQMRLKDLHPIIRFAPRVSVVVKDATEAVVDPLSGLYCG